MRISIILVISQLEFWTGTSVTSEEERFHPEFETCYKRTQQSLTIQSAKQSPNQHQQTHHHSRQFQKGKNAKMCGHHTTWYHCLDCPEIISSTVDSFTCSEAENAAYCSDPSTTSTDEKSDKRCSKCQKKKDDEAKKASQGSSSCLRIL